MILFLISWNVFAIVDCSFEHTFTKRQFRYGAGTYSNGFSNELKNEKHRVYKFSSHSSKEKAIYSIINEICASVAEGRSIDHCASFTCYIPNTYNYTNTHTASPWLIGDYQDPRKVIPSNTGEIKRTKVKINGMNKNMYLANDLMKSFHNANLNYISKIVRSNILCDEI
jgi:hypothetical protein